MRPLLVDPYYVAGGFLLLAAGLMSLPRMILIISQWADRRSGIDGLLVVHRGDAAVDALVRDFGPDCVDRCDDCRTVLTVVNTAATCGAHLLCTDCDEAHNPCGDCAHARRLAGVDMVSVYDWAAEGWVR